jgi:hypothetical protein
VRESELRENGRIDDIEFSSEGCVKIVLKKRKMGDICGFVRNE